jgi:sulfite exporter TauE/SafE
MLESSVLLLTAFMLGLAHAFDADHLVAVTTFVSKHPTSKKGFGFGARWGIGHSLSVFLAGAFVLTLKLVIPPSFGNLMELAAAATLIILGIWVAKDLAANKVHIHRHLHGGRSHLHLHSHKVTKGHEHDHAPMFVGVIHGLAGTAVVLALGPLAFVASVPFGLLYLLIFSIGTILAMMAWGFSLGHCFGSISKRSENVYHALKGFVCVLSIIIGIFILIGSF